MTDSTLPTPPSSKKRMQTFDALRNTTFRRLWSISAIYYTYRGMELAVLSWLVLELTDSPSMVALVPVCRMVPMFLLGIIAGSLADRFPRKRAMFGAQVANLTVVSGMVCILIWGNPEPWHAYCMMLIEGSAWSIDFAARRATYSELFKDARLSNAVSLDSGMLMSSQMLGPILGTVLIRFVGFSGAYVGIALLSAASMLIVLSLNVSNIAAKSTQSKESVLSYIRGAVEMIRGNPAIRVAVSLTIVFNVFAYPVVYLVPVIARDILGTNEILYGLLASAIGFGSLVGAIGIASFKIDRKGRVFSLGSLFMIVAALGFILSPWYVLSLCLLLVAGICMAGFGIMQPLIALEAVPQSLRGRAMGAIAFGIGVQPLGTITAGYLSEILGLQTGLFIITATGFIFVLLLRLKHPLLRN